MHARDACDMCNTQALCNHVEFTYCKYDGEAPSNALQPFVSYLFIIYLLSNGRKGHDGQ